MVLTALFLLATLACGGGGSAPTSPTTTTVTPPADATATAMVLTGATNLVPQGGRSQLKATAQMSDGTTKDVTAQASWESSNAAVATISATGAVGAAGAGRATISARYLTAVATLEITVAGTGGTTALTACQIISRPGTYVLTADLQGIFAAGRSECLFISSSNVSVECNGHSIEGQGGHQVGAVLATGSSNLTLSGCTVNGHVDIQRSTGARVFGNRLVELVLSNGRDNRIFQNEVDGEWDRNPNSRAGADDGILTFDEVGLVVERNVVRNVWDACFESVNGLENALLADNVFSDCPVAGIGAYHGTVWRNNVVRNNTLSRSGTFARLAWEDNIAGSPLSAGAFEGNRIEGNTFTSQTTSSSPVMLINFNTPHSAAANTLQGNRFPTSGLAPVLIPLSAFTDGGGNSWPR